MQSWSCIDGEDSNQSNCSLQLQIYCENYERWLELVSRRCNDNWQGEQSDCKTFIYIRNEMVCISTWNLEVKAYIKTYKGCS